MENQRGFSLVGFIVTIVVIAIVLIGGYYSYKLYKDSGAKIPTTEEAQKLIEEKTEEAKNKVLEEKDKAVKDVTNQAVDEAKATANDYLDSLKK